MTTEAEAIRVMRVIARLNIGGPAIQAITLTRRLEGRGYQTRLVRGRESATEGGMDYLAAELGVAPTLVAHMRRDPGVGDAAALAQLVRILRAERPQIVHTHAAKAGTLGRLAALIAFPRRAQRPNSCTRSTATRSLVTSRAAPQASTGGSSGRSRAAPMR
jgi:hypothetical protein